METNSYFVISVMNLYKGCHHDWKDFDDVKKFRAYMKRQAKKNHNDVHASVNYTYMDYYEHTHWVVFLGI